MDRLGIRQESATATAIRLDLLEMQNAVGHRAVVLPVAIPRREIRQRDVFAEINRALL
jgi:hypothetical protein